MSGLNEYLDHAEEIWGKKEPQAWTSEPQTYDPYRLVTTSYTMPEIRVENPLAMAVNYVKEKTTQTKLLFHFVRCHYCWSFYPGSLEMGYECPACGAYDFSIERSVTDEIITN